MADPVSVDIKIPRARVVRHDVLYMSNRNGPDKTRLKADLVLQLQQQTNPSNAYHILSHIHIHGVIHMPDAEVVEP